MHTLKAVHQVVVVDMNHRVRKFVAKINICNTCKDEKKEYDADRFKWIESKNPSMAGNYHSRTSGGLLCLHQCQLWVDY